MYALVQNWCDTTDKHWPLPLVNSVWVGNELVGVNETTFCGIQLYSKRQIRTSPAATSWLWVRAWFRLYPYTSDQAGFICICYSSPKTLICCPPQGLKQHAHLESNRGSVYMGGEHRGCSLGLLGGTVRPPFLLCPGAPSVGTDSYYDLSLWPLFQAA